MIKKEGGGGGGERTHRHSRAHGSRNRCGNWSRGGGLRDDRDDGRARRGLDRDVLRGRDVLEALGDGGTNRGLVVGGTSE